MALTSIDLPDIGLPCTLTPLACILVTGIAVSDIAMSDIMIADIIATSNLFPGQHRIIQCPLFLLGVHTPSTMPADMGGGDDAYPADLPAAPPVE
jgi:hypothetical protein